jgi:hypothetical protein
MHKYFEYCDKSDIEIFYCDTDSIVIQEKNMNKMNRFISKDHGCLKIEDMFNLAVIISQGKFRLRADDSNKIKTME